MIPASKITTLRYNPWFRGIAGCRRPHQDLPREEACRRGREERLVFRWRGRNGRPSRAQRRGEDYNDQVHPRTRQARFRPDRGRRRRRPTDAQVRRKAGRRPEGARNTYWRLTVWENIVYFAGIHGIPVSRGGEYFKYLLSVLKLEDQEDVEVRKLSSGYKQKTAVACALAKRTPIVFLDEPTLGLDVEASYDLGRRSGSSSPRKEGQWSSRATT